LLAGGSNDEDISGHFSGCLSISRVSLIHGMFIEGDEAELYHGARRLFGCIPTGDFQTKTS
jgi:hypothetical protein